jgi:N-acylneuraminate cytidylyltransferase
MQTIAIIPARGGSKRIPRKNIRPFCGKPMIARSIEAALESGVFDSVVVSTDDEEIAAVAESCGALAPFRRPPELSNDHASTLPVIAHAIRWWEENRGRVQFACCIYATAPFLRSEFLREGFWVLKEKTRPNLRSASPVMHFLSFVPFSLEKADKSKCSGPRTK